MSENSLYKPYRRFLRETAWLLDAFNASLSELTSGARSETFRLSGEMAVIRLHDAWARFCRELIIMSAGCRPYTASSVRLPRAPGIQNGTDVIPTLLSRYPRKRYEPNWATARECLDAAQRLQILNFSTVSAAIGSTNSPAEEIRHIRNFFAHRSKNSADQIRNQSFFVAGSRLNLEGVVGVIVPPGITRMESWMIDLRIVAEAAIQ